MKGQEKSNSKIQDDPENSKEYLQKPKIQQLGWRIKKHDQKRLKNTGTRYECAEQAWNSPTS